MNKKILWNLINVAIIMIGGMISLKAEIPVDSPSIHPSPPPRFTESITNHQRKIVRAIDGAQQQLYIPPRFVNQPGQIQQRTSTSIEVTYNGFSVEAQAAFQYAVDIWESMLTTPVIIRVNANWTPLGAGILGSCGATNYYGDASSWYPVALAEKLNGAPLNGTDADIDANFNSSFASWYLGTDGAVPFDKWDFVSVVLHELCHGLGYIGSFSYSGGQGSWGYGTGKPIIFDRFVYNGSDQALISTGIFPNPSAALGTQLTSGNVYFKGPSSGTIKLYAPGTWSSGSSIYHTDHTAHPDDLMNYALYNGTAIHDPGSLVMAQMDDIGWGGYVPPVTYSITGTISGASSVTVTLSGDASQSTTTNVSGNYSFVDLESGNYTVTPSKTGYVFSPTNRSYSPLSSDQSSQNFTASEVTYTISGTITGATGVTVQLSGSSTQSTTTDGSGNYSFSDLPAGGNYTVTPSKAGYGFTPGSRTYNPLNSNQSNQDFSAAPTMFTISGTITGASSVTVTLSGDDSQSTVTDLLGFYSFDFVQPGNITITPSKTGYIFSPVSRSFTPLNSDQSFQDFTAYSLTEYHFISGIISGASSVTVTLSGDAAGSTVTDYSGYYHFSDLVLGNYTVTPSKPGYSFTPANRSYNPLVTDQTAQNFTATSTQHQISGRITGVSQVTVYLTGGVTASTSTDIEGDYSFSGLPGGENYTVMPSKPGYAFTPSSRSYTPLAADQTNQDFSGNLQTFSIGGQVSDLTTLASIPSSLPTGQLPNSMETSGLGRLPVSQVIVQLSGGINRLDTTDLGGNYLFEALPANNSYRIKAIKTYYTFTPESLLIDHLLMDSLNNHFTAIRQQKRISGTIRNELGIGIASVVVQLAGEKNSSDTTDANGFFDFSSLPGGGSYTVTPSKAFYTFNPTTASVPELKNDTSLQFTGQINQFQISGTIRTGSGIPISSVQVLLSGDINRSDTTDQNGSYRFTGLSAGSRSIIKPGKDFHTFQPESLLIQSLQSDTIQDFIGTAQHFTVSGQTLDQNYQPLGSVQIQLTGGSTAQIYSGPTGLFSFPDLTGGLSYCLKAQKQYYRFSPDSTLIARLGSDTSLILQASLQRYTLSGQIRLIGGQPLAGAAIYLRGDSISQTLSDQNGNFSFFNLKAGRSYRLVPTKELYRFTPDSSVIVSLEKDSLVVFVAVKQNYTISGLIRNEAGQAIPQTLISLSGGDYRTTLSDQQGAFAFSDLISGTSYTVAAAKSFYSISPVQYQIANLKSDTFLTYIATRQTHTLSGRIATPSGNPLPSTTISLNNGQDGSAVANQDGDYRFDSLAAGISYTIKPSLPFYNFLPESLTIQELISDTIGNFTGIQKNYSISGTVYRHADPVPGVKIHLMGNNLDSVLTDSLGHYIFYVNAGYSYSVYPIREYYSFEPAQRNYPLLVQNEVQNFTISPDFNLSGIRFEVHPYPIVKPNCVWFKWNTNQPTRGVLRYGQNPQNLTTLLTINETGSEHTSTLYSLPFDQTYYYTVTAIAGEDSLTSPIDSFQIYSETIDSLTPYCLTQTIQAYRQQAFLNLELNEPCLVSLMYGTSSAMLDQTYTSGHFGRKFMIRITGLSPGTTYYYRLVLIDLAGHTYIQNPVLQKSGNQSLMSNSFITPTQSDQQVPDPGEIEVLYYHNSEAAIRWQSSEPAQYRIDIELDGDSIGTIPTTADYYLEHHTVLGELPPLGRYRLRLTLIDPENNTAAFNIELPEIQQAPEPPTISQFKYSDDRTFFWMSDHYASGRIHWTLEKNQRHFWMVDNELTEIHRFKTETHSPEASLRYCAVSCYPGIGICSSPLEGSIFIDPVLENDPLGGSGIISRHSSYPNPFNSQTMICFSTTRTEALNLTIYNHLGERVQTLIDQVMPAGDHQQIWNGSGQTGLPVSSGIYFYRLETRDGSITGKMLLLK